ncbi:hypothetical protein AJ79_01189 [Helicocarpus griseus UAMH5409]|uniref:Rhodopsin domain-containing protein n=1 Tax=Helicocarpus griseus UAMH5409 TaxID=1447875 RepID=A0A2B7Y7U5_9EURO|nr:hypothetical protein AJ79_01189 [Helicocarpus griseus UAMH5409]
MVDDARATVNAVGWVLATVCTITVGLRVYSRTLIVNKFGWDDALMVFAWAGAITTTALVTVSTTYGFAKHLWDIHDPEDQAQALKYTWIAPAISLIPSCAAKISVMLFLLRVLGRAVKLYHKIVLYGAALIMIGANCVSFSILLDYCKPREMAWRPYLNGKCMHPDVLQIAGVTVSAYNAFMDFLCAGFAVAMIWKLNMKRSTKIGLAILMSGGLFGAAATVVKAVMMKAISNTKDMTWAWMPIAIWYMAEMHVLIIAGSMPTLRPLWSVIRGEAYSRKYTDGSHSNQYPPYGRGGRSTGGKSDNAGVHTVALRDLDDDVNDRTSNGGSSVENILPKEVNPSSGLEREIRITNDVQVNYSSKPAHMPEDGFGGTPVVHRW